MGSPRAVLHGTCCALFIAHSARLHDDLPHSSFDRVEGTGHMVCQTATHSVLAANDQVAGPIRPLCRSPPKPSSSHGSPRLMLAEPLVARESDGERHERPSLRSGSPIL